MDTSLPDQVCQNCDLLTTCNTVACKTPTAIVDLNDKTLQLKSIETGLNERNKYLFEHLLGAALRQTPAAMWGVNTFVSRLTSFLNATGTDVDSAFVKYTGPMSWKKNAPFTGYVGPNSSAIHEALINGNIREKLGLVYVLTKTHAFTTALAPLASAAASTGDTQRLRELGLNVDAVLERQKLIAQSHGSYSGVVNYVFPAFNSWVRFNFKQTTSLPTWKGCRAYKPFCALTGLRSNSSSIQPPLATAELAYQCNATEGPKVPCALQWCSGANIETVVNDPWGGHPGYKAIADALGYRVVAGPSGTTSDIMQMSLLLGFSQTELAVLRLTMAAWMLPTNDHALFEIFLGAENYLHGSPFSLGSIGSSRFAVLRRLLRQDVRVRASSDPQSTLLLRSADVWSSLRQQLTSSEDGLQVCASFDIEQRCFLETLQEGMCGSTAGLDCSGHDHAKHLPVLTGLFVGIGLAVCVIIAVVAVVIFFWMKGKSKGKREESTALMNDTNQNTALMNDTTQLEYDDL